MIHAMGEAPGRLDFLGGVADYSGSLVLQTPIKALTRVRIERLSGPVLLVQSGEEAFHTSSDQLPRLIDAPHEFPTWTRYVLGSLWLFCQAHDWQFEGGLRFHVTSQVPRSMGVSSSAALEVATLRALESLSGRRFAGTELARLAQRAENEIVGAPCGLMDQLASSHGVGGALLPILCRPDVLSAPLQLPPDVVIVGWPSGVRHATADSPYTTARTAAFMAKRVLEARASRRVDYLSEFRRDDAETLPEHLEGAEFVAEFERVDDPLSRLQPERSYPVKAAGRFGIEENLRCGRVAELLKATQRDEAEMLREIGAMMAASHAAYSAMGLGHSRTDAMAEAVRTLGARDGFHGARISGGGSGGTVVILLRREALPRLQQLARDFNTPALIV